MKSDVPIGSVVAFTGDTNKLPKGWLVCNGTIQNQTQLSDLFNIIGVAWGQGDGTVGSFNLPDMRGLFLRGVDGGSGRDIEANTRKAISKGANTGDTVGSWQKDTVGKHNHSGEGLGSNAETGAGKRLYAGHGNDVVAIPTTNNYGEGIGIESRPMNVFVYYIIRAK